MHQHVETAAAPGVEDCLFEERDYLETPLARGLFGAPGRRTERARNAEDWRWEHGEWLYPQVGGAWARDLTRIIGMLTKWYEKADNKIEFDWHYQLFKQYWANGSDDDRAAAQFHIEWSHVPWIHYRDADGG